MKKKLYCILTAAVMLLTLSPVVTHTASIESTFELSLTPDRIQSDIYNYFYLIYPKMPGIIPDNVLQGMTKIEVTMPRHDPGLVFVLGSFGGWWEDTAPIPWKDGKVTVTAADFPKSPSEVFVFDENNLGGGYLIIIDGDSEATWDELGITNITITYGDTIDPLTTASPWAQPHITAALEKGFVPADLQGSYTNVITRAEFCRMAVQWVRYATGKGINTILAEQGLSVDPNAFTDTSEWSILAAYALGITSGVGDGLFDPSGQISREQAATMIMNTAKAIGADVSNPPAAGFGDLDEAAGWAVPGISFVQANGIMSGVGDNNFDPKRTYTREQSIVTFNNIVVETLPRK